MIKTLFHKILVLTLILVSMPLTLFIAIGIILISGFPVLFLHKRIGEGGRGFTIYKFRTMNRGSEDRQKEFRGINEAHGPVFKIHKDPRFTPIGKFLAHTGLDELPQLINVIRGDMALVGPRPLPVTEEKKLLPWQRKREGIKPGIISPWILEGYHKQTFDAWMKSDIAYVQQKNPWFDAVIIVRACMLFAMLFFQELASFVQEKIL